MKIALPAVLFSLLMLTACSTPQHSRLTDSPPEVTITFAGPVLEGAHVRFKFTLLTPYSLANIAIVGYEDSRKVIIFDENAKFELVNFKDPNGEIISAYQWTGYTESVEVTDSSPHWLYDGEDTDLSLRAAIASKSDEGYRVLGSTVQTAVYSKQSKTVMISAYKHNKSLGAN
nr:hypothetical protein [uncultured Pseudomonas sp.]